MLANEYSKIILYTANNRKLYFLFVYVKNPAESNPPIREGAATN